MLSISDFISGWRALGTGFMSAIALCILLAGLYFLIAGARLAKTGPSDQDPSDPAVTMLCGLAIGCIGGGLWMLFEWAGQGYFAPHLPHLGAQAVGLGCILLTLAHAAMFVDSKLLPNKTKLETPIAVIGAGGVVFFFGGFGVLARTLVF
jgi:hypothetical protein